MATGSGTGTPASGTLTYNDTLAADLDKVRFYLQDTVLGSGPKPADGNFTDNEITALITAEGSWQRAVAAGFEALAAAWRKYPSFMADGMQLQRSDIAKGYEEKAKTWRKEYGYATASAAAGSTSTATKYAPAGGRAVTRVDGYSDDTDSFEA